MARKHNVTGIPKLSIGRTKNSKQQELTRYLVNYKDEAGKNRCRSFYFGANHDQYEAFSNACDFLEEIGLPVGGEDKKKHIYKEFNHEGWLQ